MIERLWTDEYPDLYDSKSVTLGELVETGVFEWNVDYTLANDMSFTLAEFESVLSDYPDFIDNIKKRFIKKYWFYDISITPPLPWFLFLSETLVKLAKKYKPLLKYDIDELLKIGVDVYHKQRDINSEYPETLLNGNSDYAHSGQDTEYETVTEDYTLYYDKYKELIKDYEDLENKFLDDCKILFNMIYS